MYKNEKLPPVPNAITAVKQQQPQQPENSNSSRSRRKNPGAASKNCTSQKPRRGVSELFLSGGVQDQRDHLDRLADSLDGMALSITAVVHIAGLYVNDRAVVVVLAASGEDVVGLRVALVRVQADLASGIHGRVTEYAPLVLPTPLKGDGFLTLILSSLLLIIIYPPVFAFCLAEFRYSLYLLY